ncbi:NAD(P) transhydrogenase [Gregarina niphandrodes]|uniref:NAD(P) transhydrogenase, mitochondrial n=1 Tax=Gregarina niphandrodes TaxID=110365 RepID=A0A023AY66_GRENI|nr:NAD(P) transhydrogenase [Gregarina niphandrodes]EZG43604.1 NAD(P) transhydrogenase [Gregarina niphandrodes]|eukprot:XP_011133170.1 NAD(P) transhydrogenase [Gregarina niphandrodes]
MEGSLLQRLLCYEDQIQNGKENVALSVPVERVSISVIGCPKETYRGEARVAMTPETSAQFVKNGFTVKVEEGAGMLANYTDAMYSEAGAIIVSREEAWRCELVLKVRAPDAVEVALLSSGGMLISLLWPAQNVEVVKMLVERGVTAFGMDQIPRISRAQVFDALSSMANIAGYKAVVEASHLFGRFLGGQMTAAGRIPPAKVLIVGAGVAGLSAIATAKKMGAVVRCFDTRPACKEQVESLGGEFLDLPGFELAEGSGGYAKEMTPEFIQAEMLLFRTQAQDVDIIITTALIPGRPAPKLFTADMIALMRPGSVTVDLAAEQGGNIETTVQDACITTANGVTCVGYTDLPSRLPTQASRLYAQNVAKFVLALKDKNTKDLLLNFGDLVARASIVTHRGEKLWPAPRHLFPAPPAPRAKPAAAASAAPEEERKKTLATALSVAFGLCSLISLNVLSHDVNLLTMVVVFALAGTAGYQAVWGVTPALHTPLMSVTNAISGVTALGGMVLLATARESFALSLGALATGASFVNIIGGFTVTARMLDMFRRPGDPEEHNYLYGIPAAAAGVVYVIADGVLGVDISELTYLAASLCCVVAIGALSKQTTARFGNAMGVVGVFLGVLCTLGLTLDKSSFRARLLAGALVCAGAVGGLWVGNRVGVTELPQTVAGFHSLVGLAAMLTSLGHFVVHPYSDTEYSSTAGAAAAAGTFIGAVTLTGSLVAFAKLHGLVKSKPLSLPGKNKLNLTLLVVQAALFVFFIQGGNGGSVAVLADATGLQLLLATAALALFLGWHSVASIGGGDMPVCITVLNSYSGWALVAEGFMLDNLMLTIVGSLIGFSGGILSYIMCVAMNRSLANVLFGGYATAAPSPARSRDQQIRSHREATVEEVVEALAQAQRVIVVPGYGMAVARAQYAVAELAQVLRAKKVNVRFGIHPVAGRMPGQMNVLLAEAGVPYDWVEEMEEINDDFAATDVALVVGANDITNSAAEEDPQCAIAGMPVLQVWKAKTCVYLKRSMGAGYADLDNPVFFKENTLMLLGDAKKTTDQLAAKLNTYFQV